MATRFYLPSAGAAAVSPAYDAAWGDTTRAVRRATSTARGATGIAATTFGQGVAGAQNVLCVQFVSATLAAQTISGTIKGQIVAAEYSLAINARSQLVVRVVSGDGATVRGTLVAAQNEALSSEWGLDIAPKNRKFPLAAISPVTVTNVSVQDGDRLVFEVGAKTDDNFADEMEIAFGDSLATDLPEDETSSGGVGIPWIELSDSIFFHSATIKGGGIGIGIGVDL